jgi:membrane-associated PAP2 superfamily phosphatase
MAEFIAKLKLLTTKGEVIDAILYCHQETTIIAGTTYYLLKLNTPADASGTTLSASTGSVARVVWGKFVFQLTGIQKILSGTIYATYRAYTGGGTVNAEIDILIRKADGTVRTTIATGVSKSANLGSSWATYTGAAYSFPEYTVVDQTDYLEIDYIANVTVKKGGQYAYLRIDDRTLALADQTRSQEWAFTGVVTIEATDVSPTTATLNGGITGTENMTIRGFEWGKQSGNYTDSWIEEGTFPPGRFSHQITGLSEDTDYYFRAKAYNPTVGWIYGSELSFHTPTQPKSKYLLTNEVVQTEIWKLLETNPAYSTDTTTKATVGTSPQCTYFKFRLGVTVTVSGDFPELNPFSKVTTLTLATGENYIRASAVYGGYLYVGLNTSPCKIVKIDLSTFTKVATLTLDTGEDYIGALAVYGGYLYVGLETSPGKIVKVDLSTFRKVATLTLDTGEDTILGLAVYGGYLYASLNTSPGKIVKIDLSTFRKVATLTLDTGEDYPWPLAVYGGYLYAGSNTSLGKIVKIDLSTFTKVATLTLDTGEGYIHGLAVYGGYLYAGLGTRPGKIVKIDLSTFTKVATLTFDTGEDLILGLAVYGGHLYASLDVSPGKIVKIDLSTFRKVATLTLDTGEDYPWPLAVYGGYLYAGSNTSLGKIVKIDLSTFTKVATLTLATGEDYPWPLAVYGGYLYAGLDASPGKVVKILAGIDKISGWRSPPIKGDFPSGTWTFKIKLVNDTSYSFSVKVAVRLTKSPNLNGDGASLITVSESPNTITLPPNGSATDSWTSNIPSITLDNEYLFAEYRIHIVTPATSTLAQCSFVCDEDPSIAEESISTSLAVALPLETIVAKDFPMEYLPTPTKATQLTSKVSNITIQLVSKDYPLTLIKKGKANILKSKFTT